MDAGIRSARELAARKVIASAATHLAAQHGLEASLSELRKTHKNPYLRNLFQLEAVATILQELMAVKDNQHPSRQKVADIVLEIPGLSKTSIKTIIDWSKDADSEE